MEYADQSLSDGPSVIVGRKGSLDNPIFCDSSFWAVDTTFYTSDFDGDSKWLFYLICSLRLKLLSEATGVPSLSRKTIEQIQVRYPPKPEQTAIARVLAAVDRAMEQTEALLAKHERIKAGLMHDLLTRGLDTHGRLRDPATHKFKASPFGPIPEEWDVLPFEKVIASAHLGTVSRGLDDGGDNIALIKMGNVRWGTLTLDEVEQVAVKAPGVELLQEGDFLFNTRNTAELVGKTAVWHGELPRATSDNNLLRVRFTKRAASDFVCAYMSTGAGREQVHAMATGTTSVSAIYWRQLRQFLIPLPTPEEQAAAVILMSKRSAAVRDAAAHLAKLRRLKAGLMQDLLTGRVSVAPLLTAPR